ncbi:MAG: hypothetical protein V7K91_25650 [Nostoc sp.]
MIHITAEFIQPVRLYPPARSAGALRITTRKNQSRQSLDRLPCSQPLAGNAYWKALPSLLAAAAQ